jgi:hypothetical protein
MAGSPAFDAQQRTEIDLVVLFFGADLKSEANMVRDRLPATASWCSEQGLHLQVHSRWPEDTAIAKRHDERPGDFAETPVGKLRDLVTDKDVFVFAIIGPDMPDADVALLKFVWNARPGYDRRVRYVFLPRPGGDAEAVRSLFAELWHGAYVYFYPDPNLQGIEWLAEGLGLPPPPDPYARAARREEPDQGDTPVFEVAPRAAEEAYRGRTPAAVVEENVQFTVYRPSAVRPEVWYPLLAFAHLAERRPDAPPGHPDPLEQVQALAKQVLGDEAAYSVRVDARGGVPREGQLTFVPFVEGVDFNPRSQTFEWQEDVHQQNFRLKVRADTVGRVLRGQLTVYLGAFILADVPLAFRVDSAAPPPPTPTVRRTLLANSSASPMSPELERTAVTAVPYQKVFPSYSHKDLAIVRQAEVYGRALGHVYLRDRLALRTGEEWEVRLLELIDEADIFQLFWSSNSMRSEYVRREWEHAYALGRRGFIRPTYWEVPMPQSTNPRLPPDALAKLHFHGFYEEPPREYGESPRRRAFEDRSRATQGTDYFARPRASEVRTGNTPGVGPTGPAGRPRSRHQRNRRRRWLIVAVLAVLVALVVVAFLVRG